MCGRYVTAEAAKFAKLVQLGKIEWQFEPSYNVAPTQQVPAVRRSADGLEGLTLRWGLIPFFARGVPPKFATINATLEKLQSAPAWRGPWQRQQRCLMPAAGFYEWHQEDDGNKRPYFIHLVDQEVFAFAGIWDRSFRADGTAVESCALITMPGNALMQRIHNAGSNPHRMPAILAAQDCEAWLTGTAGEAHALLKQYPADVMVAYRVSTRVNSPRSDDSTLISPE